MNILKTMFSVCLFGSASLASAQIPIKQMTTMAEVSKELSSAKTLEIDTKFSKVSFIKAEGQTAVINGKLEAMQESDAYKINIDEVGTTATLSIEVPTDPKSAYAGDFTIEVPADVVINFKGTSGLVCVSDLADCKINIETVKGRVEAKNSAGDISITTKNGDITGTGIKGHITASTSTGNITFKNSEGELTLDSSDGAIMLNGVTGTVSTKTIAGTQTLEGINGTIQLAGSTGAIKVSKSEGVINAKTKNATINFFNYKGEMHIETEKGQIVSAGSANGIKLTASSDFTTTEGKINVTLLNTIDELTFDIASESSQVGLIAKKNSKKKKLKTGSGPIVVTGRTRTGGQVYK